MGKEILSAKGTHSHTHTHNDKLFYASGYAAVATCPYGGVIMVLGCIYDCISCLLSYCKVMERKVQVMIIVAELRRSTFRRCLCRQLLKYAVQLRLRGTSPSASLRVFYLRWNEFVELMPSCRVADRHVIHP